MKLKWRNLPAIVTFLSGLVTCIISILSKYSLITMLWLLIAVMAGFYVFSLIIRAVLVKFFDEPEPEEPQEETGEEEEQETAAQPKDAVYTEEESESISE